MVRGRLDERHLATEILTRIPLLEPVHVTLQCFVHWVDGLILTRHLAIAWYALLVP